MTREGSVITLNLLDFIDSPGGPIATRLTWVGETGSNSLGMQSLGWRGLRVVYCSGSKYPRCNFLELLHLLLLE